MNPALHNSPCSFFHKQLLEDKKKKKIVHQLIRGNKRRQNPGPARLGSWRRSATVVRPWTLHPLLIKKNRQNKPKSLLFAVCLLGENELGRWLYDGQTRVGSPGLLDGTRRRASESRSLTPTPNALPLSAARNKQAPAPHKYSITCGGRQE